MAAAADTPIIALFISSSFPETPSPFSVAVGGAARRSLMAQMRASWLPSLLRGTGDRPRESAATRGVRLPQPPSHTPFYEAFLFPFMIRAALDPQTDDIRRLPAKEEGDAIKMPSLRWLARLHHPQ